MRQDTVMSFHTKYKNCPFSSNPTGRTKALALEGGSRSGFGTGHLGSLRKATLVPHRSLLVAIPVPDDGRSHVGGAKTNPARLGGWRSALEEILLVSRRLCAVIQTVNTSILLFLNFLKTATKINSSTSELSNILVHKSCPCPCPGRQPT